MAKITLANILSGFSLTRINDNFKKIEDAINTQVLFRDNPAGEDNTVKNDVDMNGKRIYNLPIPILDNEAARLRDVQNAIADTVIRDASLIKFENTPSIGSHNVQSAIMEIGSYVQAGPGALERAVSTKVREMVSAEDYGAVGDGITDDTMAIQKAIDSNAEVRLLPGKTYLVSPQNLVNGDGAQGICINIPSNRRLVMYGATVKRKDGTTTASVIGNTGPISNVIVEGGTVDCNRTKAPGDTCGVVFFLASDCTIRNVWVKEVSLIGIGFRNINTGYGRNVVTHNRVTGSNYIGIQCRYQELGCEVSYNLVEGCNDNAIDIEGSGGSQGIGNRQVVVGNRCYSFRQGIFMESVGEAIITDNYLQNFSLCGITLNTISANTGIRHIIVANNQVRDGSGQIGLWIRNTSSRILVEGNLFSVLQYGIQCTGAGGGSGGASYVSFGTNQFEGISKVLIHLPRETNALVFSRIQKQDYLGNKDTGNGAPFSLSPITNSSNFPTRAYRLDATPAYFMSDGVTAPDNESEYKDGVAFTTTPNPNPAWGGAYAVYVNSQTIIYTGANTLVVGRYVKINGTLYKVAAKIAETTYNNTYAIQTAFGANGNFLSSVNAAYPVVEYFAEWMEA